MELQEENTEWKEHATVVDTLAYTIKKLTPGSVYRFRVRAENVHGRSEPSSASEDVRISLGSTVKDQQCSTFNNEEDVQQSTFNIKPGGDFKTRFIVHEELGKGRFGVVFKVVERESGQTLAAKIVKCIKAKDKLLVCILIIIRYIKVVKKNNFRYKRKLQL